MKTASNAEYATLVRYLLGELPEGEQERVEERYMLDEHYSELRDEVEMDLVDAYVAGTLTPEERHDFEAHYLITADRKKALQAACLSKAYRDRIAQRVPKPELSLWKVLLRWFSADNPPVPAMAAVLAVAVIGGSVLLIPGWYVYMRVLHQPKPIADVKPEVKPPQPQPNPPPTAPSTPPKTEPIAPSVPAATAALAIDEFTVEPQMVSSGTAATLKWSVKNASEVRIEPGIGVVGASGTRSVSPQQATTYTLTAKGANGASKTETVTVQVAASPPAIQEFSASRTEIEPGQAVVFHWKVSGAEEVSIDQGIGKVQPQGSQAVFPTASKTYVLVAKGPGGSVNKSIPVTVTANGPAKIVRFSADPSTIGAGEMAVLRWEVKNASEVRIEPDVGVVEAQGVRKVSPQTTTKFKLFAVSEKGTFFKEVQVKVKR
jgi:hypothetical protein